MPQRSSSEDMLLKLEAAAQSEQHCTQVARAFQSFIAARRDQLPKLPQIIPRLGCLLEPKCSLAVAAKVSVIQSIGLLGSAKAQNATRSFSCVPLIDCLRDGDWRVRRAAAETMGLVNVTCSESDLDALLRLVKEPSICRECASKERSWMVRRAAVLALSLIGQRYANETADSSGAARGTKWVEFQSAALQRGILACLEDDHSAVQEAAIVCVRRWAVGAATDSNRTGIEALLDSPKGTNRKAALDAYSQIIGMPATKASADVAEVIGVAALPRLLVLLETDSVASVRRAAVQAGGIFARRLQVMLGTSKNTPLKVCSERLSGALLGRLTDEDPWVRGAAVEVVTSIYDVAAAAPELARRLVDLDWLVRAVAAARINEAVDHIRTRQRDVGSDTCSVEGVVESLGALWQPPPSHGANDSGMESSSSKDYSELLEAQMQDQSWWLQNTLAELDAAQREARENNPTASFDDGDDEHGPVGRGRSRAGTGSMDGLMLECLSVGGSSKRNGPREQVPNFVEPPSAVRASSDGKGPRRDDKRPLNIFRSWRLPSGGPVLRLSEDSKRSARPPGGLKSPMKHRNNGDSASIAIAKASPRHIGWV